MRRQAEDHVQAAAKLIEDTGYHRRDRELAELRTRLDDRTSGSHRIYLHPRATRPLSVQPRGKDAKPYQIRQLRDKIEEFGLKL